MLLSCMPTIQPKFGLVFTREQDAKKYDKDPYSFFWWSAEQRKLPKSERGNQYGQLYYVVNGPADKDKDVFTQALQDFNGQRSRSVAEGNDGTVVTAVGFDNKEAHATARASLHKVHDALAVKADAPVPTVIEGTVLNGSSLVCKACQSLGGYSEARNKPYSLERLKSQKRRKDYVAFVLQFSFSSA